MIRGAFIFAVGLAIGYSKGIQENDPALEKITEAITRFNSWVDEQGKDKGTASEDQADTPETDNEHSEEETSAQ